MLKFRYHFYIEECIVKKAVSIALVALMALAGFAQSNGTFQSLAANEGFVILNGLALYVEKSGGLEYKEALVIGDRVVITGRVTKFKVDGAEREYIKLKAPSGTEGWARTAYIVQNAGLAVIKADKASIYSEPRVVKMTASYITKMTIVAVMKDPSPEYAKVLCYDVAQNKYYTDPVFVAREDLSYADNDVNAVILYMTAMNTKNKDIRANLLSVIQKRYSASIFMGVISAALNPQPVAVGAGDKKTTAATGFFVVNDNKVNVRATPDEKAGAVLTQVNKDQKVEVIEVTDQMYTIDGVTAFWYRLKDPAGWVFGSFLAPAQ
jgi:hypothetical protein